MLDYIVHVDFTDSDDETLDGSDIVDQVKGQERDVNVLPFDGLDQIQNGFTELNHAEIVHAKDEDVPLKNDAFPQIDEVLHSHSLYQVDDVQVRLVETQIFIVEQRGKLY